MKHSKTLLVSLVVTTVSLCMEHDRDSDKELLASHRTKLLRQTPTIIPGQKKLDFNMLEQRATSLQDHRDTHKLLKTQYKLALFALERIDFDCEIEDYSCSKNTQLIKNSHNLKGTYIQKLLWMMDLLHGLAKLSHKNQNETKKTFNFTKYILRISTFLEDLGLPRHHTYTQKRRDLYMAMEYCRDIPHIRYSQQANTLMKYNFHGLYNLLQLTQMQNLQRLEKYRLGQYYFFSFTKSYTNGTYINKPLLSSYKKHINLLTKLYNIKIVELIHQHYKLYDCIELIDQSKKKDD